MCMVGLAALGMCWYHEGIVIPYLVFALSEYIGIHFSNGGHYHYHLSWHGLGTILSMFYRT